MGAKCLETWLTGVCADPWFHLFLVVGWVGGDISFVQQSGVGEVVPACASLNWSRTLSGGEFGWGGTSVKK